MLREVLSFDINLIVSNSRLLDITHLFFEYFFVFFFIGLLWLKVLEKSCLYPADFNQEIIPIQMTRLEYFTF